MGLFNFSGYFVKMEQKYFDVKKKNKIGSNLKIKVYDRRGLR